MDLKSLEIQEPIIKVTQSVIRWILTLIAPNKDESLPTGNPNADNQGSSNNIVKMCWHIILTKIASSNEPEQTGKASDDNQIMEKKIEDIMKYIRHEAENYLKTSNNPNYLNFIKKSDEVIWACSTCSLHNPFDNLNCTVCDAQRPENVEQVVEQDPLDGYTLNFSSSHLS